MYPRHWRQCQSSNLVEPPIGIAGDTVLSQSAPPKRRRWQRVSPGTVYLVLCALLACVAGRAEALGCATLTTTGWATAVGWTVNVTNSSWCCGQTGVVCSATDPLTGFRRVTSLVLSGFSLTGMLAFYLCVKKTCFLPQLMICYSSPVIASMETR